jgi:sec-independent protein translocase protein TatB
MDFFNVGGPELIVILILAGIVMGPERIGQAARWLGKVTAQLQRISRGFALQLRNELDTIDQGGELKTAMQDVHDLRQQVDELRRELKSAATNTVDEGRQVVQESVDAVKESKQIIEGSIRPSLPDNTIAPPALNGGSEDEETPADEDIPELPNILEVPDDPEE